MAMLDLLQRNDPRTLAHTAFAAATQASSRQMWIEVNRPLTGLGFGGPGAAGTGSGGALNTPASPITTAGTWAPNQVVMPIGMDIKNITVTGQDVDAGWMLNSFLFGGLNLVSPVGTAINLSVFDPRLEHIDRLAPWIGAKVKNDMPVTATLQNMAYVALGSAYGTSSLVFHGFSINAYQAEQVCAIQTRIEPSERNIGSMDIMDHMRAAFSAVAGTAVIPGALQPHAQTGSVPVMPNFGLVGGQQLGGYNGPAAR